MDTIFINNYNYLYNQKLKDFINEASNEYDNIIIEKMKTRKKILKIIIILKMKI